MRVQGAKSPEALGFFKVNLGFFLSYNSKYIMIILVTKGVHCITNGDTLSA